MSDARTRILAKIAANKIQLDEQQIHLRPAHALPQVANLAGEDLMHYFCKQVLASQASYSFISKAELIPQVVQTYLSQHPLGQSARRFHINNPDLIELAWPDHTLALHSIDSAVASITKAYCGIAETGSLALLAEPGQSSAAYFLPEILIVVLHKQDLVATQEACFAKLRKDYAELPRTVTLVTGPSRTGDIEQQLVIGAHGPRHEHILIIEN